MFGEIWQEGEVRVQKIPPVIKPVKKRATLELYALPPLSAKISTEPDVQFQS